MFELYRRGIAVANEKRMAGKAIQELKAIILAQLGQVKLTP